MSYAVLRRNSIAISFCGKKRLSYEVTLTIGRGRYKVILHRSHAEGGTKMKRRIGICLALSVVLSAVLMGCGDSASTESETPQVVKLEEGYVALDNEYARITMSLPTDSKMQNTVTQEITVENKTDKTIAVAQNNNLCTINDKQTLCTLYVTVEPTRTVSGKVYWSNVTTGAGSISSIGTGFIIEEDATKDVLYKGPSTIAEK